jgi:hypothetical protein
MINTLDELKGMIHNIKMVVSPDNELEYYALDIIENALVEAMTFKVKTADCLQKEFEATVKDYLKEAYCEGSLDKNTDTASTNTYRLEGIECWWVGYLLCYENQRKGLNTTSL